MLQRIFGALYSSLPVIGGVGSGYSAGQVGSRPSASTGHLAVTANGVDRQLTILPGWAQVIRDGGASSYDPRAFFAESDANDTSVTLTANATGSTRNDTACLKIDQATTPNSDGSNLPSFVVIAGQAGGALSAAPADGNLYLPLANIAVANGAGSVAQGNVTDLRRVLLAPVHPLLVPPSIQGFVPTTSYGTGPIKLDEQSTASAPNLTLTVPAGGLYRTLVMYLTGRSDNGAAQAVTGQFNTDATGNYDYQVAVIANVTQTNNAPTVAGTSGRVGVIAPSGAAAGAMGSSVIEITNADSSTLRKNWHWRSARWDTDAAASASHEWGNGQWRNTSAAITSIKLMPGAGNLVNFRAVLYGYP